MAFVIPAGNTEAQLRTAIETTAVNGDTVQIPPCNITLVTNPWRIIDKTIRIVAQSSPRDTIITGVSGVPIIQITNSGSSGGWGNRIAIEGLQLIGTGVTPAAISFAGTAAKAGQTFLSIRNNMMSGCVNGISVAGADAAAGVLTNVIVEENDISGMIGRGVIVTNANALRMRGNNIGACALSGIRLTACNYAVLTQNTLSVCNTSGTLAGQTQDANAYVALNGCNAFTIDTLEMDGFDSFMVNDPRQIKTGVALSNCYGGSLRNLVLVNALAQMYAEQQAVAYLAGTRSVSRGAVVTSNFPLNPFFYDRFSPQAMQTDSGQWINLTAPLSMQGYQN